LRWPAGPGYLVAEVLAPVLLHASPGGPEIAEADIRTQFGSARVLAVVRQRGGWFGVSVPERSNGTLACLPNSGRLLLYRVRDRLVASLSTRRLELLRAGRPVLRTTVAVGRAADPTPLGRFAVTDRLIIRGATHYGYGALALSGHQPNIPQGWGGGDRLAIHGTDDPASIGLAASQGCVRAGDAAVRALIADVPLGTPVFVRP